VRQRVIAARNRQLERLQSEKKTYANAQMMPKMIRQHCAITAEGEKLLENAITRLGLSARAHDRILKVARTIADLDSGVGIEPRHLSEAIQYRTLDRSYWGLRRDTPFHLPLAADGSEAAVAFLARLASNVYEGWPACSIDSLSLAMLPIKRSH
jgi:magnesium chelatase subunit ChlI-like protein